MSCGCMNRREFLGVTAGVAGGAVALGAAVAPRGVMLSTAITETQGNPWGIEQNYHSAKKAIEFLGVPDNLVLRNRYGEHGTTRQDIEDYVDLIWKTMLNSSSLKPLIVGKLQDGVWN